MAEGKKPTKSVKLNPELVEKVDSIFEQMSVMEREQKLYETIWAKVPRYRDNSPGQRLVGKVVTAYPITASQSLVYDLGCGTGKAALEFRQRGAKVVAVDFVENCLNPEVKAELLKGWLDFKQADLSNKLNFVSKDATFFFCTDVMEHLPNEEIVDKVLTNIAEAFDCPGFFNIATYEDGASHWLKDVAPEYAEEKLHKTVEEAQWWLNKLSKYFTITLAEAGSLGLEVFVTKKG